MLTAPLFQYKCKIQKLSGTALITQVKQEVRERGTQTIYIPQGKARWW